MSAESTLSSKPSQVFGSIKRIKGLNSSEGGDTASVNSYAPTLGTAGDNESVLGDVLGTSQEGPAWKLFSGRYDNLGLSESSFLEEDELTAEFYHEFDAIRAVDEDETSEGKLTKPSAF